jgi:tryptophanyl-tRNA synthetase
MSRHDSKIRADRSGSNDPDSPGAKWDPVRTHKQPPVQQDYAVEVFTGVRPTGDLTVANYLGAVLPTINLQERGGNPLVFVADIHALTTHAPHQVRQHTNAVVADYLALGLDPSRSSIFVQSAIQSELFELTTYLLRHVTIAELLRVPTLKDKVNSGTSVETANGLLAVYPVLMAADILIQRPRHVPVGHDQLPHIELTRRLAERFNSEFCSVFPLPDALERNDALRILGLKGSGKMGKSHPHEALFLTDTREVIIKKIKTAQTAFSGEMPPVLQSHISIARGLARGSDDLQKIDELIECHMAGKPAMAEFKRLLTDVVLDFVGAFQERRRQITGNPGFVNDVLERGTVLARNNAQSTLEAARQAMF